MSRPSLRLTVLISLTVGCLAIETTEGQTSRSPTPASLDGIVRVDTIAGGLEHPWALAFLPDGRMLVTERPGRVRIVDEWGALSEPLRGVRR